MSGGACAEFKPNLFKKNTCQTCFKSKDQHAQFGGGGEGGVGGGGRARSGTSSGDKTVIKEGFLTKAPPDLNAKFGSKQWKKRWFVLTSDSTLTYYDSEKTYPKKPLGEIKLGDVSSVADGDAAANQFNCLALTTPTRVFYVKAESKADIDSWCSLLQEQLAGGSGAMATARCGSTTEVDSPADGTRSRGTSQIAKARTRTLVSEGSRRETLSMSRRSRGESALETQPSNRVETTVNEDAGSSGPSQITSEGEDWQFLDEGEVSSPPTEDSNLNPPTEPNTVDTTTTRSEPRQPIEVTSTPANTKSEHAEQTTAIHTSESSLRSKVRTEDSSLPQEPKQIRTANTDIDVQEQIAAERKVQTDLRARLAEKELRCRALESQMLSRKEELEQAKAELGQSQRQSADRLDSMTAELKSEKDQSSKLMENKAALDGKVTELTRDLVSLKDKTDALQQDLAAAVADAALKGSEADKLTLEQGRASKQFADQIASLEEKLMLDAKLAAVKTDKDEAESARLQERYESLHAEVRTRDNQVDELSQEVANKQSQLDASEREVGALKEQLAEERQSKRQMLDKLAEEGEHESQSAVKEVEAERDRLRREHRRSTSEFTLQIAELSDKAKEVDELQRDKSRMEAELISMKSNVTEYRNEIATLQLKHDEAIHRLTSDSDKHMQQKLKELNDKLSEATGELEHLAVAQAALLQAEAKIKDVEGVLAESQSQLRVQADALEKAEANLHSTKHQHAEELNLLNQQLAAMQSTQQQTAKNGKDATALAAEVLTTDLQARITLLQEQLQQVKEKTSGRIKELSEEVEELRATAASTESEKSRLQLENYEQQEKLARHAGDLETLRSEIAALKADSAAIPSATMMSSIPNSSAPSIQPNFLSKGMTTVASGRPKGSTSAPPSQSPGIFKFSAKSSAAAKPASLATEFRASPQSTQHQLDDLQQRNYRLDKEEEQRRRASEQERIASNTAVHATGANTRASSSAHPLASSAYSPTGLENQQLTTPSLVKFGKPRSLTAIPASQPRSLTTIPASQPSITEPPPPSKPKKPVNMARSRRTA